MKFNSLYKFRQTTLLHHDCFLADAFQKLFEIFRFKHHRRCVVTRVKLHLKTVPHLLVDEQFCRVAPFVEVGKGRNASPVHLQVPKKHLFGGKFKLGAPHIGSEFSHIRPFVKGKHHKVVVVAFFVFDVQALAGHTVVHMHDIAGFLRRYYGRMPQKSVGNAEFVQVARYFFHHFTYTMLGSTKPTNATSKITKYKIFHTVCLLRTYLHASTATTQIIRAAAAAPIQLTIVEPIPTRCKIMFTK